MCIVYVCVYVFVCGNIHIVTVFMYQSILFYLSSALSVPLATYSRLYNSNQHIMEDQRTTLHIPTESCVSVFDAAVVAISFSVILSFSRDLFQCGWLSGCVCVRVYMSTSPINLDANKMHQKPTHYRWTSSSMLKLNSVTTTATTSPNITDRIWVIMIGLIKIIWLAD